VHKLVERRKWSLIFKKSKKKVFQTFVQVILISSINAVAAAIYVYMQFARISEVLILIGQFTWMLAHGKTLCIEI